MLHRFAGKDKILAIIQAKLESDRILLDLMSPTRSDAQNYETLRDCVSELLIAKLSPSENKQPRKRVVKGRKNEIKPVVRSTADDDDNNDAADLSDTIEVSERIRSTYYYSTSLCTFCLIITTTKVSRHGNL